MDPRPPKSPAAEPADTTAALAAYPFLSPPERPDEIGRLGAFRILSELGHGGMGVVFRAEEVGLKRLVALKVMLPAAAARPGAKARFLREAEAQAKVEHDHIIAIHRIDEVNGVPFLAMPLLKGQTLAAALKLNRHPPVAELVRIGTEMADGLSAAHAAGLIHRDIKPANVWLEGNKRRVKILDFGLARVAHESADAGDPTVGAASIVGAPAGGTQLTAAGAVMGTPAYMSPEQARGQSLDARTDLFSLGTVLYEMAAGRKPFTGPSAIEVMAAVVTLHPQPPHELNPDVPERLSELIRRLMAKDPKHRPATAAAVTEELEAIGRGVVPLPVQVIAVGEVPGEPNPWADIADTNPSSAVTMPLTADAPPTCPPAGGRKPLLLAAVAVLLAGAVVAAVVVAMNRPKGPRDADPPAEAKGDGPKKDDVAPKPKDAVGGTVPSAFFNGKDLSGWTVNGKRGEWSVRDGAILYAYRNEGHGSYDSLISEQEFGDFELSFVFRHLTDSDRGFVLRIRHDETRATTTGLSFARDAVVTNAIKKAKAQPGPDGAFKTHIRYVGKKLTVVVNGTTLADEEFDLPARGKFRWSNASNFKGAVAISDIRFAELSAPAPSAFFNGKDLSGWAGAGVRHWKVIDGTLVSDSPAYALQSERAYSDFELSFRVKLPHPQQGVFGLSIRQNKVDDGKGGSLSFMPDGVRFSQKKNTLWPTKPGEFNDVALRCIGKRITITVNGSVTLDEQCDIPAEGLFSLRGVSGLGNVTMKDIRFTDLSEPAKK